MIIKGRAPTTQRRKIEVFTTGCPCCIEAVKLIEFLAGNEHDVQMPASLYMALSEDGTLFTDGLDPNSTDGVAQGNIHLSGHREDPGRQ
jgi:hypothetical protein